MPTPPYTYGTTRRLHHLDHHFSDSASANDISRISDRTLAVTSQQHCTLHLACGFTGKLPNHDTLQHATFHLMHTYSSYDSIILAFSSQSGQDFPYSDRLPKTSCSAFQLLERLEFFGRRFTLILLRDCSSLPRISRPQIPAIFSARSILHYSQNNNDRLGSVSTISRALLVIVLQPAEDDTAVAISHKAAMQQEVM